MNILEPCADVISTFFDCLSLDLDGLGYLCDAESLVVQPAPRRPPGGD